MGSQQTKSEGNESAKTNDLLTPVEAARYLGGVSANTLAVWRCTKRHPIPYVKIGRLVRYRLSDLDAYMDQQTVVGDRVA